MTDYVTREEIKYTLEMTGFGHADMDVELAITAASSAVDQATERWFSTSATPVARYYTPSSSRSSLAIDDLLTVTTVKTDGDGSGSFETTWATTDYNLAPYNAALEGRPYEELEVSAGGTKGLPIGVHRSVEITGTWGWLAVPADVKQAVILLTIRLLRRAREAPFGVAGMGIDNIAVRIAKDDPDVQGLLAPYVRGGGLLVA